MIIESIKFYHHGREVDGTYYKPEGANKVPIVIFSHGYNGHKSDFYSLAKLFAQNEIGAVCYNFCGGSLRDESGFPTTDMTLFTEQEDLIAVIDTVKNFDWVDPEHIYLFGASQGGMVSSLVAESYMSDIAGLVLLYPAFCIADNWNARFQNLEDIPETVDLWGMNLGRKFFESIHKFQIKDHIGQFNKKVFIIHGSEDSVVPLHYATWAQEHYKDASLQVFTQEGHGFSEEATKKMEAMSLTFIKECIKSSNH